MRTAGFDIGSRSVELVVVDETGFVVSAAQIATTPSVREDCARLLSEIEYDRLLATGYGRGMAEVAFDAPSVTEIKAYARGAEATLPGCRTVLDIGGQDTKVIALDGGGRAVKFEMNDRCAAGAGRFLEIMAAALVVPVERFGDEALAGVEGVRLSSMCTVFAESEVVGLVTRGVPRADIARAVHQAILRRTASMLGRAGGGTPLLFAGGAARNPAMVHFLEEMLGHEVVVPESPQMVGALGAALLAGDAA